MTKRPKTAVHQQQVQSYAFGTNKVSRSRLGCSKMSFAGILTQKNGVQTSHIPKSLSIADLTGARKLIKPVAHDTVSLTLE